MGERDRLGVLGKIVEAGDRRALGPWHFQPYYGTGERCSQSQP